MKKGELQVGEKERTAVLDQLRTEIALQISSLCVNPSTNRPYPPSMIQKALEEIGFSVRTEKSAKSQALEGIRKLLDSKVIPIQRARMRLRITPNVKEKLPDIVILEEDFDELVFLSIMLTRLHW